MLRHSPFSFSPTPRLQFLFSPVMFGSARHLNSSAKSSRNISKHLGFQQLSNIKFLARKALIILPLEYFFNPTVGEIRAINP
jgi:hypothetical protein